LSLTKHDKRIYSMYIFHYSCLILKYFGFFFELLTSWEINVFSDTRLILSRQNPAIKPNTDWFWAAKKVIQLSSKCSSPFSKSEMKIYKTYKGYRTQFFCFEAQRASRKTRIESDPNFLRFKCCHGLWPISQVSDVQKLFYYFFRTSKMVQCYG